MLQLIADLIIFFGGLIFAACLIPQAIMMYKDKRTTMSNTTTILTAIVLFCYIISYLIKGYPLFAVLTTFATCLIWLLLFVLSNKNKNLNEPFDNTKLPPYV